MLVFLFLFGYTDKIQVQVAGPQYTHSPSSLRFQVPRGHGFAWRWLRPHREKGNQRWSRMLRETLTIELPLSQFGPLLCVVSDLSAGFTHRKADSSFSAPKPHSLPGL